MDSANYELDLPRENIHIRCFAHNIMNYRYHWHVDDYELSILPVSYTHLTLPTILRV